MTSNLTFEKFATTLTCFTPRPTGLGACDCNYKKRRVPAGVKESCICQTPNMQGNEKELRSYIRCSVEDCQNATILVLLKDIPVGICFKHIENRDIPKWLDLSNPRFYLGNKEKNQRYYVHIMAVLTGYADSHYSNVSENYSNIEGFLNLQYNHLDNQIL